MCKNSDTDPRIRPIKRLFYDIETSPNVALIWRPGSRISVGHENIIKEREIICICYKWEGEENTHYLTWDKRKSDKKMLKQFVQVLIEADEIVAHNGANFDLPWIRTRCLKHKIPIPPVIKQVDTLKLARSLFAFNSNRLDYIAKFLGEEGKISTSYSMWKKILLTNDQDELQKMRDYCIKDVEELERIFNLLKNYVPAYSHAAVSSGGNLWDCPECTSSNTILSKTRTSASGFIQRQMNCKDCGKYYSISNQVYQRKLNHDKNS